MIISGPVLYSVTSFKSFFTLRFLQSMADSDVKFHEIFKYFKVKYFIVHL